MTKFLKLLPALTSSFIQGKGTVIPRLLGVKDTWETDARLPTVLFSAPYSTLATRGNWFLTLLSQQHKLLAEALKGPLKLSIVKAVSF